LIFVALGTQKFQFNRLLKIIDDLLEENVIREEVFVQSGHSTYVLKNCKYKKFLNRDEYIEKLNKCDVVITHGGVGTIITALKSDKKVIAMARRSEFAEHVDNHQIQILEAFKQSQLIVKIETKMELKTTIETLSNQQFNKYISNTKTIINSIESFITNL